MHDLIVANFILCTIGWLVCLLRARELSPASKLVIRCRYLLYFFVLSGSSISWLWGAPATLWQIILAGAVVIDLVSGSAAWRYGPPAHTFKRPPITRPVPVLFDRGRT